MLFDDSFHLSFFGQELLFCLNSGQNTKIGIFLPWCLTFLKWSGCKKSWFKVINAWKNQMFLFYITITRYIWNNSLDYLQLFINTKLILFCTIVLQVCPIKTRYSCSIFKLKSEMILKRKSIFSVQFFSLKGMLRKSLIELLFYVSNLIYNLITYVSNLYYNLSN